MPDSHTSTDSCDQRTAASAFVPLSVGTGRQPRCRRMSTSSQELAQLSPQLAQARHGYHRIPPGCAPSGRPIERTVPHLLIDSRPGPKSGVGCRLTTLFTLLHCQVSRSVRVPALSVGAGEGNSLAYQRRLQVPKLNGIQLTDGKQEPTHKWNRCAKRSFMRACNRAIRHGQAQPLYLCTFRFLEIPEECLAADHRCLAWSRMLTECWRRQPTPSLDGMARTGPQPHVCFEMWFGCTSRSQLVCARKLCSGDALPPDLPWVLTDNNRSIHGSQCALLGPLTVRRTTPLYSEKRPCFGL